MSDMMDRKRKYKSGAQKRAEKKKKTESSLSNTRCISTYIKDNVDDNEDPYNEVEDDSFSYDNAEKDLNFSICPKSSHGETGDKDESFTSLKLSSSTLANLDKNKDLVFDTTRKFPSNRGHFKENITDCDLKILIMQHKSCRPTGPFEYEDDEGNSIVNFSARYYNKHVNNMSIQRLWLCYSMELKKAYCEVCWLFADCASSNYENHRGWINGVSGGLHNMLEKIKRHEASNVHIQATAVYMRWKSGKIAVHEDNEKEIRNNALFWVKVLDRIMTIILTLATLSLAFRGHNEQVHENICEGGNFLGMVYMMAQYDEILAKVISLPARATKYLSPKIQNELIQLLAKTVTVSLVNKINASPFWALILDSTSDITRIDQLSVIIQKYVDKDMTAQA